jgi:hypothetical protein
MHTNLGTVDRVLRTAVGLGLIGATAAGAIGPWGCIGAVPLVTALVGWCPAYTLLGVNTCKAA